MTSTASPDVVCLGESMVALLPTRPGRLADVDTFERSIGGAESNVACTLARAGHRTRWVGRVGADPFGDHLVRTIAAAGVDTWSVVRDPRRPTGVYFRTDGERATSPGERRGGEVAYYRAGSAASAMSPQTVDLAAAASGRVLHLTGITAALSADCLALLRALTAPHGSPPGRSPVSFDVNYRMSLWRSPVEASEVLAALARRSELVFVGEDEAAALWGPAGGPAAIRTALPEPDVLVVKQGAAGATAFVGDEEGVHVPAPCVDVVAHVGAGDAFAAGYLSGTLRGLPVRDRLRHGHLFAAAALTVRGDLAPPPARAHADRLVALPEDAWGTLRLAPGWTTATSRKATAP